jgi:LytS/YehU family sensor histidine kinase
MEMPARHHPPFEEPHRQWRRGDVPPPVVGERDILSVVVLLLMCGANLGIKGYFRSRDDRKRLAELEHQNLEQQLEYLRYQINPHFFMNTLNNIHALVDIDPAKAQETIVELSKMMRFVLYEGDKKGVPLTKEMEFIRTYVALMQLRYTDKVKISLNLPDEVPDRTLPPLMLISFIENAFKHGVSYQRESFIEIGVAVDDDRLIFVCRNSKADVPNEEKGGVGLVNVRKRLNLLYDHDYSLCIRDDADVYTVELNIPLS